MRPIRGLAVAINNVEYTTGKIAGSAPTVAAAAEGQRNSTLFWAACRARDRVADGSADEGFITDVLLEAACHVGLPLLEAQRTIASGMQGWS